jgi:hypothetical protein
MVAEKIAACIVPPSGACHLLEHTFKPVKARAEGCQVPFRTPRMPCPAWQVPPSLIELQRSPDWSLSPP